MYEAKHENYKILVRAKARDDQINGFFNSLAACTEDEIK